MNQDEPKSAKEIMEKTGYVKMSETQQPKAQRIVNQKMVGPSWRRPPDANCDRCGGSGIAGNVVCHCVTKVEYSPKSSGNSPEMTIKE